MMMTMMMTTTWITSRGFSVLKKKIFFLRMLRHEMDWENTEEQRYY